MLASFILLGLAGPGTAPAEPAWVAEALASPPVGEASAPPPAAGGAQSGSRAGRVASSGPTAGVHLSAAQLRQFLMISNPPPKRWLAEINRFNAKLEVICWYEDKGDYRGAMDEVRSMIREYPDAPGGWMRYKVCCEVMLGDSAAAYSDIVREAKRERADPGENFRSADLTGYDETLLILSFICAQRGQVYNGQLAFCDSIIRKAQQIGDVAESEHEMSGWHADRANDVAIASCYALSLAGTGGARMAFLEQAFRIDPSDTVIGRSLALGYGYRHLYADERRVGAEVLKHLKAEDPVAKELRKDLAKHADQGDGPFPPKPSLPGSIPP